MNNFKNLIVWQKAVDLAVNVYKTTKEHFPTEERFGLVSQMTRSAVSIPSNIAEGAGRNTEPDFQRFLGIATGSSFELETQLIIAKKLEFLPEQKGMEIEEQLMEIQKMIFNLQKKLNK
jgi:four helix bundle protein